MSWKRFHCQIIRKKNHPQILVCLTHNGNQALVHFISWNKTSKKTDKLKHVWVICSKIFANKSDVKEEV